MSEFCLESLYSERLLREATLPEREVVLLFGLLLTENGLAPGGGVGRTGDEDIGEFETRLSDESLKFPELFPFLAVCTEL